MKKAGILNKDISEIIAGMGHMDMLVISDAGLPIPKGTRRIDLAIRAGLPKFLETVEAISYELSVESIILAEETCQVSPHIWEALNSLFPDARVEFVSHSKLKDISNTATAVIRTGEFTPYANVILVSGVGF